MKKLGSHTVQEQETCDRSSAFYHTAQDAEEALRWGFPSKPAETRGIGRTIGPHGCSPEGLVGRDVVQKFEEICEDVSVAAVLSYS